MTQLPPEDRIEGPISGPEHPGLAAAIWAFRHAPRRRPTEADAPPPSTFPMTPAARAALEYSRQNRKKAS